MTVATKLAISGLILAVVVGTSSGCYLARKSFGQPGPIEAQRSRAVLHDPFPNNDVAPAIVGGRPLGFDRPLPEAKNNQYFQSRGDRVPNQYGY